MTTRRSFVKTSALFSAALLTRLKISSPVSKPVGLQLYSVRDAMARDPVETLKKVAKIGYKSVEASYGGGTGKFYGFAAGDFSKVVKDSGLAMPSFHFSLGGKLASSDPRSDDMHDTWSQVIDDGAAAGVKYIVYAGFVTDSDNITDSYMKMAEHLNIGGEGCRNSGMQLCYHNHSNDFIVLDGQTRYHLLLKNADEDLVKMELDTYWMAKAGQDPLIFIDQYPGRFPVFNIKDIDITRHIPVEIGKGSIDFKRLFEYGNKAGLRHFFVGQDQSQSQLDSAIANIEYVQRSQQFGFDPYAANYLPNFPFPPPAGYQSIILTRENFKNCKLLADVDDEIVNRINKLGYLQKSYYPHEYGYSMVTMIELVEQNGVPSKVDRFKGNHGISLNFWDYIVPRKGYYRMFAFILSKKEFRPGKPVTDPTISNEWPVSGSSSLPNKQSIMDYTNDFICTLIIYEFKSEVPNSNVKMDIPTFFIDLQTHLNGSLMLSTFPYYH